MSKLNERLTLVANLSVVRIVLLLLLVATASGCGGNSTDEGTETVVQRIEGRVFAELGGEPIDGATVDLGWGGHFSLPEVRKSALTDSDGEYTLMDTLTYSGSCPFQWMRAEKEGYRGLRSIEDSRVGVRCTTSIQRIDIPLEPASLPSP